VADEQYEELEMLRDDANDDVDLLEDELGELQKELDEKQHALDYAPPFRVRSPPYKWTNSFVILGFC